MSASSNASTNAPAGAPQAKQPSGSPKRKKILLTIGLIFLLAAVGYGIYWFLFARFVEATDDAYVQGNVVQITPQVAGTVSKIFVNDTDIVKAGQPLVMLDPADADVALAQAEAQLAQTVREVRTLYASQAQSSATVAQRRAELLKAQDDLKRRKSLAGSGAVSGEEIRHAELAVQAAQAAVAAAQEQLASGRALTEGTTVEQHPNVKRAAARVQEAMLAKQRTTIYAPVGGQVAKRNVQVGQRLSPGAPLMAIVPLDQLWVDANFKESQLSAMHVGQPVTLTTDLYGGKVKYDGKVVGLAAGTGSAFALLPAQNATGNWIKVVQRVPVRIAIDPKQLAAHPLRIGLSIQAEVDLHNQGGQNIGNRPVNTTAPAPYVAAANPEERQAKSRINAIIAANMK